MDNNGKKINYWVNFLFITYQINDIKNRSLDITSPKIKFQVQRLLKELMHFFLHKKSGKVSELCNITI